MIRSKNPEERRAEIVQAATDLFVELGFASCKISDIVRRVCVSQGTFYYYFTSKEAVLEAIVEVYLSRLCRDARSIADNIDLNALTKLERISDAQLAANAEHNARIHRIKGVDIHERILAGILTRHVPIQAEVIRQGQAEGVFGDCDAQLVLELFVAAANVLFDPAFGQHTREEMERRLHFVIDSIEQALGAPTGSLRFYRRLMSGGRLE